MTVESEAVLLQRFVARRDAAAFGEIVRRHGPMVYGACMRVLADRALAADATQETFYQLIARARQITESVPAWLHRVATRKAIDVLRNETARTRREARYAVDRNSHAPTWQDLSVHVDEALDGLDEQRRQLLIEHFFEGKSMAQIGRQSNLSGVTISRRIEEAVGVLREQLRKRGLIAAPVALGGLLAQGRAQAMPGTLGRELGKMAIAGGQAATGGSAVASAVAAGLGGTVVAIKTKAIVGAAVVVIAAVGIQTYRYATRPGQAPPPAPPAGTPAPRQNFSNSLKSENETPEPIEEHVADEEAPPPEPTTESPTQQPAALPEEIEPPPEDESQDQTPSESTGLDLSSPESTARSFAKALISGDAESILACWSPDAEDYAEVKRTFYGGLTDGEQRAHNKAIQVFQALDPDAMPIVAKDEIDGGIMVRVQATFKEDVTVEGMTFRAGDTFDFPGVTLRPSGENWLIYNIDG